jgi:hypothetical protein
MDKVIKHLEGMLKAAIESHKAACNERSRLHDEMDEARAAEAHHQQCIDQYALAIETLKAEIRA